MTRIDHDNLSKAGLARSCRLHGDSRAEDTLRKLERDELADLERCWRSGLRLVDRRWQDPEGNTLSEHKASLWARRLDLFAAQFVCTGEGPRPWRRFEEPPGDLVFYSFKAALAAIDKGDP